MRILIMTGSKLRHLYFASELALRFPDTQILIENFETDTGKNYTKEEVTPLMRRHFEAFEETEKVYFEGRILERKAFIERTTIASLPPGTINSPENVQKIASLSADLVVVYSTSILKMPLISLFPSRILNLHAGLSPYYRGAGTNLFPFVNDELQYVGMTVHYLDAGIDSGNILLQGRPQFEPEDNVHTTGCKCVVLGTELMASALLQFEKSGTLPPGKPQDLTLGKLYLKKHFSDSVLETLHQNLSNGMVARYLKSPVEVELHR